MASGSRVCMHPKCPPTFLSGSQTLCETLKVDTGSRLADAPHWPGCGDEGTWRDQQKGRPYPGGRAPRPGPHAPWPLPARQLEPGIGLREVRTLAARRPRDLVRAAREGVGSRGMRGPPPGAAPGVQSQLAAGSLPATSEERIPRPGAFGQPAAGKSPPEP